MSNQTGPHTEYCLARKQVGGLDCYCDDTPTSGKHSPLPWTKDVDEEDGTTWFVKDAEENKVITTDIGFYTKHEGDYDLIIEAVNNHERLRVVNRELVEALAEILSLTNDKFIPEKALVEIKDVVQATLQRAEKV